VARALGPAAGLAVLTGVDSARLGSAPLVRSIRGDLLERAGSHAGAAEAFTEAAARTRNKGERALLQRRTRKTGGACRNRVELFDVSMNRPQIEEPPCPT
jgi:predicted RNA polymerase sigma factor